MFTAQSHLWKVTQCEVKLPFVCKKKGEVKQSTEKAGCPNDGVSTTITICTKLLSTSLVPNVYPLLCSYLIGRQLIPSLIS